MAVGDKRILAKFVPILYTDYVVMRTHARNLRAVVHITIKLEIRSLKVNTTKKSENPTLCGDYAMICDEI